MKTQHAGTLLQFRCHIGHVLTAETMLAAQFTVLEVKLAACLAALNERAEVCRQMIETRRAQGADTASLEAACRETLAHTRTVKDMLESEWIETGRQYGMPE
jgi:two-component system chemotaxis response regulator CheB